MSNWIDEYGIKYPRDYFTTIFNDILPNLLDDFYDYHENYVWELNEFLLFKAGDEFYILNYPTGLIINWYKNLGRANNTNKILFDDELRSVLFDLKEDIDEWKANYL